MKIVQGLELRELHGYVLTSPRRRTAVELEKGRVTISQSHEERPVVFWLDIQAYLGTRIGQIPLI